MRVLVTRAEAEGAATAARLRRAGHEALLVPLSRVVPLNVDLARLTADAVVVTSAHAIHGDVARFASLPLFAVGPRTSEAARRAGFVDVRTGAGTARDLVDVIGKALQNDASVLFLAGETRKADVERGLAGAGFTVNVVETYRLEVPERLPDAAHAALEGRGVDAVLHYSRDSARRFSMLVHEAGLGEAVRQLRHLCLSGDVAAGLAGLECTRIEVAARPDEAALLTLLDEDG